MTKAEKLRADGLNFEEGYLLAIKEFQAVRDIPQKKELAQELLRTAKDFIELANALAIAAERVEVRTVAEEPSATVAENGG